MPVTKKQPKKFVEVSKRDKIIADFYGMYMDHVGPRFEDKLNKLMDNFRKTKEYKNMDVHSRQSQFDEPIQDIIDLIYNLECS